MDKSDMKFVAVTTLLAIPGALALIALILMVH